MTVCLFSARSRKSTFYICNLKLPADCWRKQIIKTGPKKASVSKGRRNLLFVRRWKATTVITSRKNSSHTMEEGLLDSEAILRLSSRFRQVIVYICCAVCFRSPNKKKRLGKNFSLCQKTRTLTLLIVFNLL